MTATADYVEQDAASRREKLPSRQRDYKGVKPYRRRLASLDRLADPYLPVWRVLNEFIHPYSGKYLFGERDRAEILRGVNIKNSVASDAARTCASGLHGGLTSPSKPWFEITHPDSEMMESEPVKRWMHAVQEIERSVLAKSNFYGEISKLYLEAVVYGTAAAIIDRNRKTGIRVRTLTIGEYRIGLGEDMDVNTLARRIEMTPAQMREKFGDDNPGFNSAVRDALDNGRLDEPTHTIVHIMQPQTMFGDKPHPIFTYESVYFMESADDGEDQKILRWEGHRSKPFVAVRWATSSDEAYGYSPGMLALADDRMLQTMERDYIKAVEMVITPPVTGPTSLDEYMKEGGLQPGDYVPHSETGNVPSLRALYQVNPDFNNTRQKIQETVGQIQNKFYNHLFLSILFNNKQMTATEVAQRLEEKAMVLGPVLERFQAELFDPILDRVFVILYHEFGVIPEPPEEIAGANLKIDYIGSLAQTVKMVGLSNIANALPLIAEIVRLDPPAIIKLNTKEAIDHIGLTSNFQPKIIRSDEECEEIEAAQAQQQQQAMQMQQMQVMADAAKKASETSLQNGSLLTGAEGGMEGAMNGA